MSFRLFDLRQLRVAAVLVGMFTAAVAVFAEGTNSNLFSIADLKDATFQGDGVIRSFRVEGVVCAAVLEKNLVVLQDNSATMILIVPSLDSKVTPGDWLAIEGNHCPLTRTRYGIQLGTAPVVDYDGTHPALTKSGKVFLESGFQPIRVLSFNGASASKLAVEYEGPGIPRQKIPAVTLCQKSREGGEEHFVTGVRYAAYEGDGWRVLPDFPRLRPVATGVATNFDISYRPRDRNYGLVFEGYIQVDRAGLYTFYLTSNDGSRLFAGDPDNCCKTTFTGRKSDPRVTDFESVSSVTGVGEWTLLKGEVTFAGQNDIGWELNFSSGSESVQALLLGGIPALGTNLIHQPVQAWGICEASRDSNQRQVVRMVIPGPSQIQLQNTATDSVETIRSSNTVLTLARQVQRLDPGQARKNIPVRIKGIVTQASLNNLVLQDSTGGVFVHYYLTNWTAQPRIGDSWQIEGITDPGDFSPVVFATSGRFLGNATLPEPIHPIWDQWMNGSLDAQYVEIQGVVLAVSGTGMEILTPDGKIHLLLDEMRNSYTAGRDAFVNDHGPIPPDDTSESYVGSLVRIRGCVVAKWDRATRQVNPGEIRLVAASVNVDQPRPLNPFALPTRKASDLLWFDPRPSTLLRTKVAGQVVFARPHEFFVQDGQTSFRAMADTPPALNAGDLVEVVGFPQLGGVSPVLQAAQIRKTGSGPLPDPVRVTLQNLLDRKLDSMRVEIDALLLSDMARWNERVLELQAGPHHFLARLASPHAHWTTLPSGSQLKLTGVYSSARDGRENGRSDPFELLLNRPADIVVLQQPSWWTVRHTVQVMAALAVGLGMALIWVTLLRRKVEARTKQLQQEIEERQQAEKRHAIEEERTRVAQDLHDELGAGLTEISILGSLANTRTIPLPAKDGYIDQLTNVARSLVTSLDEIVWAVNPQYDSVESLATYYSLFAQRFLSVAGIACRPQISPAIPEQALDSRMRHGIFRAFKEALNNVVRHSEATEVRLIIKVEAGQLVLSVIDNGRGFKSLDASPGKDGLSGLSQRMRKLGGDCFITSHPGQGTTVELRLTLNPIQHG